MASDPRSTPSRSSERPVDCQEVPTLHRRPRRHPALQLVDGTSTATLPFGRRAAGRAHDAVLWRRHRPADVQPARRADRTDKAAAMVTALRDADAVVVGSPGYHGGVSGLVKNALDYIEDLRTDPAGLPRQHAVGLHQLRVRVAGRGRHARSAAGHRPRVAGVADSAWRSDQFGRQDLGRRRRAGGRHRLRASWTCWPPNC